MKELQNKVSEFIEKYNLEISPELRYIDLTSEMGEVGKELLKGNGYGEKQFEKTENLESELGDTLFSLICLSNTLDIDLEKALAGVLDKYKSRFDEKGHIGSEVWQKSEKMLKYKVY